MTSSTLSRSIVIGAMTGIRSMSAPATLAWRHGGPIAALCNVLAFGEAVVDKMPFVGDRTEALPLTGRVIIGAVAGGYVARRHPGTAVAGALLGGASALVAAHLATRLRKEFDIPATAGGLLEDAVMLGLGALYLQGHEGD